jgi:hypothetical protein
MITAFALALLLSACATPTPPPLGETQAVDLAWQALKPNSSSGDFAAWEVAQAEIVTGNSVLQQFEFETDPLLGCNGPLLRENEPIGSDVEYWYVHMRPLYATPIPVPSEEYSATAPPNVPEPFIQDAYFLIDLTTKEVTHQSLWCVVY